MCTNSKQTIWCLVDSHPARYWALLGEFWKLGRNLLCFLTTTISFHDVWFQSLAEIRGAHNGIDDGQDDQDNCDHSKTGQTLPDWKVIRFFAWLVHSCQLENEVSQSAEE